MKHSWGYYLIQWSKGRLAAAGIILAATIILEIVLWLASQATGGDSVIEKSLWLISFIASWFAIVVLTFGGAGKVWDWLNEKQKEEENV